MAHKAYKFRLYPTATQEVALSSQLETLRQVYNATLAYWRDLYESEKRSPRANELYATLSAVRNLQLKAKADGGEGPFWLTQISAVSMRYTCVRVKVAFENYFRRVGQKAAKVGYPRFKSYGRLTSIPFNNYGSGCTLRDRGGKSLRADVAGSRRGYRLDLFGVGRVKVLAHRAIAGTVKTACVGRDADGKWYVVLVAQYEAQEPKPKTGPAIGIDVGLERFLTTSDGDHVENPRHMKNRLRELRRLQRSASRKVERAKRDKAKFRERKNLKKSFAAVARLHVRVRNLRKEGHHKVANSLVRRCGTICVEDLNIRGMLKSGNLSRSISDAAWGGFLILLQRKAENAGVRFVKVDARGTSQTCPKCGGEARKKLRDRTHDCSHCGYTTHRDHASAEVILARGVAGDGAGLVPARHNPCDSEGVGRSLSPSDISSVTGKSNRSRRRAKGPQKPGGG